MLKIFGRFDLRASADANAGFEEKALSWRKDTRIERAAT
jgi:hypothetical protein